MVTLFWSSPIVSYALRNRLFSHYKDFHLWFPQNLCKRNKMYDLHLNAFILVSLCVYKTYIKRSAHFKIIELL